MYQGPARRARGLLFLRVPIEGAAQNLAGSTDCLRQRGRPALSQLVSAEAYLELVTYSTKSNRRHAAPHSLSYRPSGDHAITDRHAERGIDNRLPFVVQGVDLTRHPDGRRRRRR
jgi:hypothetical protein